MARPTSEQAASGAQRGAVPRFGAWGFGVGWDAYLAYLPELSGVDLVKDMYLMAETDETVGAMLYCIQSAMRPIVWDYMPCVDGQPAPEDAEAKRFADLFTSMLGDMNRPFSDHIEDFQTMLWAGFAPVELITKRRTSLASRYTDSLYGIRTLNLLDQTTIWDFIYEGDEPTHMKQIGGLVSGNGLVPLSKTLLYRTRATFNNPRGRPLLKNAWRVWRLKRKIQDSEALGIERELCGLPIFEMPQEVIDAQYETDDQNAPTEDAKRAQAMVIAAKKATQDMRLNRSGGLVIPSDTFADETDGKDTSRKFNFRIQTTGGQRSVDSRTAARDYDHAIARVAMMQFLTLGQRSGGSYALADDQSSMAVAAITALADVATDQWNMKAVPMLGGINAIPSKYWPMLRHSDINKNGIAQIGQFLSGLAKAEALWAQDVKVREALLKLAGVDFDHDAQQAAADTSQEAAKNQAKPPPAPAAPGAKKPPSDSED